MIPTHKGSLKCDTTTKLVKTLLIMKIVTTLNMGVITFNEITNN